MPADPSPLPRSKDVLIGTAGWSVPRDVQDRFPPGASHLARYAQVFPAAEINSSFHRPHRPSTYARWAETVPASFRFSAKLPKTLTHVQKLADPEPLLDAFLAEAGALGRKLACLLVQLPPSLAFDAERADAFFRALRERFGGWVTCEPRHETWFGGEADALLIAHRVARVAADPARVPTAVEPGGWRGFGYYRLHGSPRIYYSSYPESYLDDLTTRIRGDIASGRPVWCIFDNTASGAATGNALDVLSRLARAEPSG